MISNGYQIEITIDELTGDFFSTVGSTIMLEISDPPTASYNFDNCTGISSPFIAANVAGSNTNTWGCSGFGNNFTDGVEYNGYSGSSDESDAWLILDINAIENGAGELLNNANLNNFSIEVSVRSFFSGAGELTMWYSNDYPGTGDPDPSTYTWVEVTDFAAGLPEDGSQTWTSVSADVSAVTGSTNGYVAFRHTGAVAFSADSWTLDDLSVFAGE